MSSSAAARSGSIRQRSKKACNPCRRRKRKCDGQKPCSTCVEFEYDCNYEDEAQQEKAVAVTQSSPSVQAESTGHDFMVTSSSEEENFFEPNKGRYYDAGSAISFPRALALSLKAGFSPRLHSFAYNIGAIPEKFVEHPSTYLSTVIDLDQATHYAKKYFEVVNRVFPVVDEDPFYSEIGRLWANPYHATIQFECMTCFVILLGSLFSWPSHFAEQQELADHGQALLDKSSFYHAPSLIHIEHAQAWVLRTLYLRCITRPNITWISSCIMMHILETLGMHREYHTLGTAGLNVPTLSPDLLERRRRVFWLAWTLNRMISFELGRTPTFVLSTNCVPPQQPPGTPSNGIIGAYRLIYPDEGQVLTTDVNKALLSLAQYAGTEEAQDPVVALICADIACGLYRQIYKDSPHLRESLGHQLVLTVQKGLSAARNCLAASQPWWLLISMPFQFICVAVAVGKRYILNTLPEAMGLMRDVRLQFDSHMTREACETAQTLLETAINVRDEENVSIRQAQNTHTPFRSSHSMHTTSAAFDEFLDANFPFGSWDTH